MSQASIIETANGIALTGELDSHTGPELRRQGQKLLHASKAKALVIDLSQVTRSTSVGLSLLLAFMRDAKKLGKQLAITELPNEMQQIAMVSGLLKVLPLVEAEHG